MRRKNIEKPSIKKTIFKKSYLQKKEPLTLKKEDSASNKKIKKLSINTIKYTPTAL